MDDAAAGIESLRRNIESVFLGKPDAVQLVIVTLLAQGHVLIEDIPGVGKTVLARSLAKSLNCSFRRIQFTPDLLPGDILGVSVYDQHSGEFVFKQGPIFANVVLADEINRTTPRTQSSLLEAMNDFQVSVDGRTYQLDPPFMVLATQNPYEYEGTYLLPESQLDRFLMRITIGYPDRAAERRVLASRRLADPLVELRAVLSGADVLALQARTRGVQVADDLADYILAIAEVTRQAEGLLAGVSPRGCLALYRASQARALTEGRDYVVPDDVKALAVPVLAHRIIPRSFRQDGRWDGTERVVREALAAVSVPL
jgi:MoxR-like ATPase